MREAMPHDEDRPPPLDLGLVVPHGLVDPEDPSAGILVGEVLEIRDGVPLLAVHLLRNDADGLPEGMTLHLPMSSFPVMRARVRAMLDGHPDTLPPKADNPTDALDTVLTACAPDAGEGMRDRIGRMADTIVATFRVSHPGEEAVGIHAASLRTLAESHLSTLDAGAVALLHDRRTQLVTDRATYSGLRDDGPLARAIRVAPVLAEITNRAFLAGATLPRSPSRVDVERVAIGYLSSVGVPRKLMGLVPAATTALVDLPEGDGRPYGSRRDGIPFAVRATSLLEGQPGNWLPRDAAAWRSWFELVPLVDAMATKAEMGLPPTRLDGGDGWEACTARLVRAAGVGVEGLRQAFLDLRDMFEALKAELLDPALHLACGRGPDDDNMSTAKMRDLMACYGSSSLTTILDASRRWHVQHRAIAAVKGGLMGDVRVGDRWEAALPDMELDGMTFVVLTDASSLSDEGARGPDADGMMGLSHCVGSYDRSCATGACRVVSIRTRGPDGGFARSSTAELSWDPDEEALVVEQHLGRRNGLPPKRDALALARYVEAVQASPDLIGEDVRVPRDSNEASVTSMSGYDWHAPGNWERLARAWAPFLPRTLRGVTPDAFARSVAPVALAALHDAFDDDPEGLRP